MRRIYYICIYILLGVGIASCADNLDSDKYFKDRMLLEDGLLMKHGQKGG